MLVRAWEQVTALKIANCIRHCGFSTEALQADEPPVLEHGVTAPMVDVLEDVCFADYVDVDSSAMVRSAEPVAASDDEEEDKAPVRPSAPEVMARLNAAQQPSSTAECAGPSRTVESDSPQSDLVSASPQRQQSASLGATAASSSSGTLEQQIAANLAASVDTLTAELLQSGPQKDVSCRSKSASSRQRWASRGLGDSCDADSSGTESSECASEGEVDGRVTRLQGGSGVGSTLDENDIDEETMSGDRDVEHQHGSRHSASGGSSGASGSCCHWWNLGTTGSSGSAAGSMADPSREGCSSAAASREEDDESVLLRLLELQDRRGVAAATPLHQCRSSWNRKGASKGKRRPREGCRHLLLLSLLSKSGHSRSASEPGPSSCESQAAAPLVEDSPPEKSVMAYQDSQIQSQSKPRTGGDHMGMYRLPQQLLERLLRE
ncbi:hypothetical protein HPB51_018646 [Rhipicephalus microplus]|uniref:Uncharacterized protein n=1 Tax=Rhipicephalus microplus TaxID=6941 RepID=A0A9J6F5M9_RHIMP|nr:hypothetical protein HPB51_018646 [Rhipicephalus microplus]